MKFNRKISLILLTLIFFSSPNQLSSGFPELNQSRNEDLTIAIEIQYKIINTGDTFQFKTSVTFTGIGSSAKLIVAMNIVNLQDGSPVDPEDWSPERKQFVSPISSGSTSQQRWTVHAIIKGDYIVYMVAVPIPSGETDTSIPVSSSAIHLTVSPFTRLNPGGILPVAIIIPSILVALFFVIRKKRNSQID